MGNTLPECTTVMNELKAIKLNQTANIKNLAETLNEQGVELLQKDIEINKNLINTTEINKTYMTITPLAEVFVHDLTSPDKHFVFSILYRETYIMLLMEQIKFNTLAIAYYNMNKTVIDNNMKNTVIDNNMKNTVIDNNMKNTVIDNNMKKLIKQI